MKTVLYVYYNRQISLSVDVEMVKLFTIPQILRDSPWPEPFVRLSLFANAILEINQLTRQSIHQSVTS